MNSEKVKEIKKALENNANYEHYNKLVYIDGYKCKTVAYADILTLINELKSENERLIKLQSRGGCRVAELGIENQQLKNRNAELEDEIERLETVVDIANERTYRKKFTDEWRKEYQKELDKQGNGHIAGHPDFDLVYKLYFEQKDRIAELEKENALIKNSVAMRDYKTLEEISNNKVKQFAERLKDKVKNFCGTEEENHYYDVSKEGACEEIDETLKEYEK